MSPDHLTERPVEQGDLTQGTDDTSRIEFLEFSRPKVRPLGLKVVYSPPGEHEVDIVFVHGIGASSQSTWSKNGKPELFWPSEFLPLENDFKSARIMTFDYEFTLRHARHGGLATVTDFAEHLLFDLKNAQTPQNEKMKIGKVYLTTQTKSRADI